MNNFLELHDLTASTIGSPYSQDLAYRTSFALCQAFINDPSQTAYHWLLSAVLYWRDGEYSNAVASLGKAHECYYTSNDTSINNPS